MLIYKIKKKKQRQQKQQRNLKTNKHKPRYK